MIVSVNIFIEFYVKTVFLIRILVIKTNDNNCFSYFNCVSQN